MLVLPVLIFHKSLSRFHLSPITFCHFCSLWIWCPCRQLIDPLGEHLLGCGHGPLRVRRHDALRQALYHALLNDHPRIRTEQRCASDGNCAQETFFTRLFIMESPDTSTLQCATLRRQRSCCLYCTQHCAASCVEKIKAVYYDTYNYDTVVTLFFERLLSRTLPNVLSTNFTVQHACFPVPHLTQTLNHPSTCHL